MMRRIWILCSVLCLLSSSFGQVVSYADTEPVVIFSESFDGTVVGEVPAGWITTTLGGTAGVQAIPSTTDKSLRLVDNNSSQIVSAARSFTPVSTTVITEFKVRLASTGVGYMMLRNSGEGNTIAVRIRATGTKFDYTTPGGSAVDLQSYSTNTWYSFKLITDITANQTSVYINNVLRGTALSMYNNVTAVDTFTAQTLSTGTVTFNLNDVTVSSLEPEVPDVEMPGYSTLITKGEDERLQYTPYSIMGDVIPDYSDVGYMGGGVTIPDLPVTMKIKPRSQSDASTFDSTDEGEVPIGWAVRTDGGTVDVNAYPSATDKSLKLNDTSTSLSVGASKDFTPVISEVTVEFKVQLNSGATQYIRLNQAGSETVEAVRLRFHNGKIHYFDGSENTIELQTYSNNTNYTVKIAANVVTQMSDVYIDEVRKVTGRTFYNTAEVLNNLSFTTFSTGTGTSYINDVSISNFEDDTAAIQAAIDTVSKLPMDNNGFRGVLLLRKGLYYVKDQLNITTSGVVIRGEGEGEDGTVIRAIGQKQYNLFRIAGKGTAKEVEGSRIAITDAYVPVGTKTLTLSDTSNFQVGDQIIVHRRAKDSWITLIGADQISGVLPWEPFDYNHYFERGIVAISGNTITLDIPTVMAIDSVYADGFVYAYDFPGRIEKVGVENMRLESTYSSNTDLDHGWIAVIIDSAKDIWVRKVTAIYFGQSAVDIQRNAKQVTVQEVSFLDAKSPVAGGYRYPFHITGQQNLVEGSYARSGRHDFVLSSRVSGPNVFFNNRSVSSTNFSEPHHRFAVGALYDNISVDGTGSALMTVNRGNSGSGHGWAGAQMVFWNTRSNVNVVMNPPGVGEHNFAFGITGQARSATSSSSRSATINWVNERSGSNFSDDGSPFIGDAHFEYENALVQPQSLYLQQLADRVGNYDLGFTTVNALEDSYVNAANPDVNYGAELDLPVVVPAVDSSGRTTIAFMKFDLEEVQSNLSSARLYIHSQADYTASQNVNIYAVNDDSWSENSITWNNHPALGTLLATIQVSRNGPAWNEAGVSDFIAAQQAGDGIASMAIVYDTANTVNGAAIQSSETAYIPNLKVRYQINASAPSVSIDWPIDQADPMVAPYSIAGQAEGATEINVKVAGSNPVVVPVVNGQWSFDVSDIALNMGAEYMIQAYATNSVGSLLGGDTLLVNPAQISITSTVENALITSLPYALSGIASGASEVEITIDNQTHTVPVTAGAWSFEMDADNFPSKNYSVVAEIKDAEQRVLAKAEVSNVKIRLLTTLTPIADGHANESKVSEVSTALNVRASGDYMNKYTKISYLKFNVADGGQDVGLAKLVLPILSETGGVLRVYAASTENWTEANIKWSSKPGIGDLIGTIALDRNSEQYLWYEFDLGAFLYEAAAEERTTVTLAIAFDQATAGYYSNALLKSRENVHNEPFIEVSSDID